MNQKEIDLDQLTPLKSLKMRISSALFVVLELILSLGCSAKSDQPHNYWPYLRSGMSLDSAKLLTAQAGWVRDTRFDTVKLDNPDFGFAMLWFKNIQLPGIRNEFTSMLTFANRRLMIFSLTEEPGALFGLPNSPPAHNRRDYEQLVAAMARLYGPPSRTDSTVHKYFDAKDRLVVDTTYMTGWADSAAGRNRVSSVILSMPEGRLSYLGM